jgi:hypothetical protein
MTELTRPLLDHLPPGSGPWLLAAAILEGNDHD